MKTAAILLAAGCGKRMQSNTPKQYMQIKDKPVLYYTLKVFEESFVDEVVLVVLAGEEEYCQKTYVQPYGLRKVRYIVAGGKERYHSVANGLKACQDADYYFIHDAARPFLTQEILNRAYDSVKREKACVVGMPVKDTVKIADENGMIAYTPNRSQVWTIQTPQVFEGKMIREAYTRLINKEQELVEKNIQITDDAMVVETLMNQKVKLVEGSYKNIKITTPEDIQIANAFLNEEV